MLSCLPEQFKMVVGLEPQTNGAPLAGDYVSLKNCNRAFIVVSLQQGNAATVEVVVNQATAVAGTSAKVISEVQPIWSNLDAAASDTMVKRTSAVDYTTDAGVKNKLVVIQIDPSSLDVANGFDCINVTITTSNAANIVGVNYFLDNRFKQATPPAAITD